MTDMLFNAATGQCIGLIEHLRPEESEDKIAAGYALTAIEDLPDGVADKMADLLIAKWEADDA